MKKENKENKCGTPQAYILGQILIPMRRKRQNKIIIIIIDMKKKKKKKKKKKF